jgi:hypothetical protein
MTTKQVTKQENGQAVAIPTDGADGLSGEFGEQDVTIPVCSLTQPMSQDRGPEGTFYFPDGRNSSKEIGEDALDVAVLDIVATRTLWGPVDSGIGAPVCRSGDRKMGLTNYPEFVSEAADLMEVLPHDDPTYVVCSECRFGPSAADFEKIDGMWCPFGYTLLMANVETGEPFLYFIKGSQMKTVKKVIVSPTLMRWNQTGAARPWLTHYRWTPRHVQEKEKKRNYWVADITAVGEFEEKSQEKYAALSAKHRGRASEQTFEAEPAEQPAADDHPGLGS